jgi:hypothetical protein
MKKLFIANNYLVALNGTTLIGEYSRGNSIYKETTDSFIIKEDIDRGELPILKTDVDAGNWLNAETGGDPYTQETLRDFLRSNTGFKTASGGSGASQVIKTLTANGVVSVSEVTRDCYISGNAEIFQFSKIAEQAIITPEYTRQDNSFGPIGNLGANMTNSNLGDLCYNNFGAAGTDDLPFYTFDFGAGNAQAPDRFKIYWYQFNNYVGDPFRIEASDDLNTWTTIVGGLTGTNIAGNIQDVDLTNTTPFRYWRLFCEGGFPNGTAFMVVREIIPQQAGTIYESIEDSSNFSLYFDADGILQVESFYNLDVDITINYSCP